MYLRVKHTSGKWRFLVRRGLERLLKAEPRAWNKWKASSKKSGRRSHLALRDRGEAKFHGDKCFQAKLTVETQAKFNYLYRIMKTWEPINKGICTIKESNAEDIIS